MGALLQRINKADRSVLSAIAIAIAVVLFLSVNVFAALTFGSARSDLTQGKLFTLTKSTNNVLRSLKEPVTLRLFQSIALLESAPGLNVYSDRVTELLRTYQELSNGVLRIEIIDPIPFSLEEDRAIQFQLRSFNLTKAGEQGYFGLVGTNSVDDVQVISFMDPSREAFLEYDLTRMVANLARPAKPIIGILDGVGVMGQEGNNVPPFAVIRQLQSSYDVRVLKYDANVIPPTADVLMVVHPAGLSERTRYAIDQYALAGGPVIVFVDPLAENSPTDPQNRMNYLFPTSEISELFERWGIQMATNRVVGDRTMAIRVSGFGGPTRVVVEYVPWLQVRPENLNQEEAITALLQLMRISSGGAIQETGIDGLTVTPLIQSTRDSMLIDTLAIRRRDDPSRLLEVFDPSGVRQTLAVRITGKARTAWPSGAPAQNANTDPNAPKPQEPPQIAEGNVNIIVVADVDMLGDTHVVNGQTGRPISNNGDFVVNAIENLAGGGALIGLRGRGLSHRPFTTVERIEDAARTKYFATEQRLEAELAETQNQLAQLQALNREDVAFQLLSTDEQRRIIEFNRKMLTLRQQLRDVRAALNADIDTLETQLQFANIALVPILVVAFGMVAASWRRARLRSARARAGGRTA
ncbi:MAG: hypothetical protein EXQ93_01540 [Alphaproteobacteria bacterium]|nr:hypothetical protein [Alphaproteobacteria bacterium]